jgi:phage/conjugal plasmid C-4 type zinc finger TraR family protein
MADIIDLAQQREEADREAALTAFQNRPRPKGESAYLCASCGERIDEQRRRAVRGTQFCTFCAQRLDGGR